jgi:hypothetical protein
VRSRESDKTVSTLSFLFLAGSSDRTRKPGSRRSILRPECVDAEDLSWDKIFWKLGKEDLNELVTKLRNLGGILEKQDVLKMEQGFERTLRIKQGIEYELDEV